MKRTSLIVIPGSHWPGTHLGNAEKIDPPPTAAGDDEQSRTI